MRASRLITSVGMLLVGLGLWVGFVGEQKEPSTAAGSTAGGASPESARAAAIVARPASPAHLPGLTLIDRDPALEPRTDGSAAPAAHAAAGAGAAPTVATSPSASTPLAATEIPAAAAAAAATSTMVRQSTSPTLVPRAEAVSENAGVMRPIAVRPPQSVIEEAATAADSDERSDARKAAAAQRRIRTTTPRSAKSPVRETSNLLTNPLGVR